MTDYSHFAVFIAILALFFMTGYAIGRESLKLAIRSEVLAEMEAFMRKHRPEAFDEKEQTTGA